MRKQTRRLWSGDWQRDEPAPAPGEPDTFVVTPDEGDDPPPPIERRRNVRRSGLVAAILALVAVVVALTSGGGGKPLTAVQPPAPPAQAPQFQVPQAPQGAAPQGGFGGGPDLTGAQAQKAAQAALSKYPGQVERVTPGSTGSGYIVHVFTPDGYEVHVLVGPNFHVQGSDAGSGSNSAGSGTSQ